MASAVFKNEDKEKNKKIGAIDILGLTMNCLLGKNETWQIRQMFCFLSTRQRGRGAVLIRQLGAINENIYKPILFDSMRFSISVQMMNNNVQSIITFRISVGHCIHGHNLILDSTPSSCPQQSLDTFTSYTVDAVENS